MEAGCPAARRRRRRPAARLASPGAAATTTPDHLLRPHPGPDRAAARALRRRDRHRHRRPLRRLRRPRPAASTRRATRRRPTSSSRRARGRSASSTRKGRLTSSTRRVLDLVAERFRADDGPWVGLSGRQRVLVYNPELVAEADLPDSVLDLTDARYDGRSPSPRPTARSRTSSPPCARARRRRGHRLAHGLADNGAADLRNNNAIVEAVSRGEIAMGLVNHYYNVPGPGRGPGTAEPRTTSSPTATSVAW